MKKNFIILLLAGIVVCACNNSIKQNNSQSIDEKKADSTQQKRIKMVGVYNARYCETLSVFG